MQVKLDSVLIGWTLAGVVILLAVVSAIVGAASGREGGFDVFLARLAPPVGVALLIIATTGLLKLVLARQAAVGGARPAGVGSGSPAEGARTPAPGRARGAGLNLTMGRPRAAVRSTGAGPTGGTVGDEALPAARSDGFGLRITALVTGLLGSLFSLGIGLLLIVLALLVEEFVDELGPLADFTDADEIVIWVLAGLGIAFLIVSAIGILGASLAIKKPVAALVLLSIVASINALLFVLSLFGGEWQPIALFLISTGLLVTSVVCAFKGRVKE